MTGRYAAPGVAERLLAELARAYEVLPAVRALAHDPGLEPAEALRRISDLFRGYDDHERGNLARSPDTRLALCEHPPLSG